MIAMRMIVLSIIIIGLVSISTPAFSIPHSDIGDDPPEPQDAKLQLRIKELEGQLASQVSRNRLVAESDFNSARLQVRVLELEARVAMLEQQLSDRSRHSVPSNWIPRTFNGMQYYIVPCDEKPSN